jgi:hypothetical protein
MVDRRRERPLAEHVRGVGLAVAVGAGVLLVGLAVMALFVWAMT